MSENPNRDIIDLSEISESEPDITEDKTPADDTSSRPIVDPDAYDQTRGSYFLNRFMEKQTEEVVEEAEDSQISVAPMPQSAEELRKNVIVVLKEIYDPEIPVNIYEMGLIYEVNVAGDYSVDVVMTLTTPNCPVAETMPGEVEMKVKSVTGVKDCLVHLVWEPAWDMSLMSDEARLELGLL